MENSERDGHTRPPDLPLEKPVCRSGSKVRNRYGTDWLQIGKGVHHGCILSPYLFNLYAELNKYIFNYIYTYKYIFILNKYK